MTGSSESQLDCEAVRAELAALLYDELSDDLKRSLEHHLDVCAACRAELEGHRRTMRMLDQWSLAPCASRSSIPWVAVPRRPLQGWLRPVLVGTAAALIATSSHGWRDQNASM